MPNMIFLMVVVAIKWVYVLLLISRKFTLHFITWMTYWQQLNVSTTTESRWFKCRNAFIPSFEVTTNRKGTCSSVLRGDRISIAALNGIISEIVMTRSRILMVNIIKPRKEILK